MNRDDIIDILGRPHLLVKQELQGDLSAGEKRIIRQIPPAPRVQDKPGSVCREQAREILVQQLLSGDRQKEFLEAMGEDGPLHKPLLSLGLAMTDCSKVQMYDAQMSWQSAVDHWAHEEIDEDDLDDLARDLDRPFSE